MKIGIDIDGVITNEDEYILSCTSRYCYENNMKWEIDASKFEFQKLGWDKEQIEAYRNSYFDEYIDNEPVRRYAKEVIDKLMDDGHEIYIITGRSKSYRDTEEGEVMRERVKDWLKKNDINYNKLIFARVPKIKEIKENELDIMIEDSPSTISEIKDIVKVLCYDNRYNQGLECKNVDRVYSWYDIYMKITHNKE